MTSIFVGIHIAGAIGLALYGLLGFVALWLYLRDRNLSIAPPQVADEDWPTVTVQLPVFNEPDVIQRLIHSIVTLDYPRELLEIQVLDDSTDETTSLAAQSVDFYAAQGFNIRLIHRNSRHGFKAKALQNGLEQAQGEFLAIFDADFVPQTDFLRQTIPYFLHDIRLGSLQARWGHLNAEDSMLTGAQTVALDKHFAIEQIVRHRADYFPKFNGAAGVWRAATIHDSGGWQEDTVCEDLCLSTRAVLHNWTFHFVPDVVAPAELPTTITAYKTQQARWTMGSTQCLLKYGKAIWQAPGKSLSARVYALLSMSAYLTNVMVLLLLLAQLPIVLLDARPPSWLYIVSIFGMGQPILFVLAQRALYDDWLRRLRYFPALLLIAIGLAPSNTKAIVAGLLQTDFTFERTPKGKTSITQLPHDWLILVEIALSIYCAITLLLALAMRNSGPAILLASATIGFGYVGIAGLSDRASSSRSRSKSAQPTA